MNRWQKVNLILFVFLVIATSTLVYLIGVEHAVNPFGKPWHLQSSVHEDSLSQDYLEHYQILDKKALHLGLYDSLRSNVFILIDAWGVPIQSSKLQDEFAFFKKLPHLFALHERLANRTKHAERVEFRDGPENKMYLFGGDSMEYDRLKYIPEIGFDKMQFCHKCEDSVMLAKIDSLLERDSLRLIAWTTQSSRSGDEDSLHKSLKLIADFANRHPNVQVIVQGTHRPVLCDSKIRNSYKSHWVPVVILNK